MGSLREPCGNAQVHTLRPQAVVNNWEGRQVGVIVSICFIVCFPQVARVPRCPLRVANVFRSSSFCEVEMKAFLVDTETWKPSDGDRLDRLWIVKRNLSSRKATRSARSSVTKTRRADPLT